MFENAKWIACKNAQSPSPIFRKTFEVKPLIKKAILNVCGLGYGVFTINGSAITTDVLTTPLTKFDVSVHYNIYDVTDLLVSGCNAVGAMLGNGWYNNICPVWDYEKASWRHFPKLVFQLDIEYLDNTSESIVSNSSWKSADGPIRYNHVRCGEWYDSTIEQEGFDTTIFDDSAWDNAVVCRTPGGIVKPSTKCPPIRVISTLPTKKISANVYDTEQNLSGWVRLTVQGNKGDTVDIVYAEKLYENGEVDQSNISFSEDNKEFDHHDRYTLKGDGTETWTPRFCYHGFRYMDVKTTGSVKLINVEADVVHTDLPIIGNFTCSDDMLNKIHMATRWATLTNYHSIPTDCPHREQNGWTGDALISCEQAMMNFDMIEAYRKWFRDFNDVQRPSGQLPGVIPTAGWGFNWGSGPAWDSSLILMPYYAKIATGDCSLVAEFFPNMERYMDYMYTMSENYLPDFGLGDWCPPDDALICPPQLTDTGYYYADAMAMAEMSKWLGKNDCYDKYSEIAQNVRTAFRSKFIQHATVVPESQTAIACALFWGLLDQNEVKPMADRLSELVKQNDYHIDCGILGAKYIFRVLSDNGYGETLYRMITNPTMPSYAYWISSGMTTLCEQWNLNASRNHHMFSEVEHWFYRYLAGIKFEKDNQLVIEPMFLSSLEWVKANHEDISVYWDNTKVEITTPRSATLIVDGKRISLSAGNHTYNR